MRWPKGKLTILLCMIALYAGLGIAFHSLVSTGAVPRMQPTPEPLSGIDSVAERAPESIDSNIAAAAGFIDDWLVARGGHVYLYRALANSSFEDDLDTNSEAVSYYLLWNARGGNKEEFDAALAYMRQEMLHPEGGYLMWRLNENDVPEDDGSNIASDADLRAIKALLIAEERWGDQAYAQMIAQLARGLERVAITSDGYLAPYGGLSGTKPWTANEVWLSYMDFGVAKELASRRGGPWAEVYAKMKDATIGAQIHNGLFNSQLTEAREYGTGPDGGGYSINSMWIMVRAAESEDPELHEIARTSLDFYKEKYEIDRALYGSYSSNGDALSPDESPWVYALVGRAAAELGETTFADAMIEELTSMQVMDEADAYYGAIPEGESGNMRAGQFTMQESIITMQRYNEEK